MSMCKRVLAIAGAVAFLVGAVAPAVAAPILNRITPVPTIYVEGTDFFQFTNNKIGDVTGSLILVDLLVPPAPVPSSTSGCEASDFAGFPVGSIALLQRGGCTYSVKIGNAFAAGALAAIIFNEGQPGRTDALDGQICNPDCPIPSVFTSFAVGSDLFNTPGALVRVAITDTQTQTEVAEPEALGLLMLGMVAFAGVAFRRKSA